MIRAMTAMSLQVTLLCLVLSPTFVTGWLFEDLFQADIYPTDAVVFLGDRIHLWCQPKDSEELCASHVYFLISTATNGAIGPIPAQLVNASHAVALVAANEEIGGRNTVTCYRDEKRLASTFLTVERRLSTVTNATVIWNYSENKVRTDWVLGQTYFYLNGLNISADWLPNSLPGEGRGQTCTESGPEYCVIENYHYQSIIFLRVTVRLWNEQAFHKSQPFIVPRDDAMPVLHTTTIFKIVPLHHVKPGPPREINITPTTVQSNNNNNNRINSICVTVTWQQPTYFRHFAAQTTYHLVIYLDNNDSKQYYANIVSTFARDQHSGHEEVLPTQTGMAEHCGLLGNQSYHMCVSVKDASRGHWSDSSCGQIHLGKSLEIRTANR